MLTVTQHCVPYFTLDIFLRDSEAHSFVTGYNWCLLIAAKYRPLMLMKKKDLIFCGFNFFYASQLKVSCTLCTHLMLSENLYDVLSS